MCGIAGIYSDVPFQSSLIEMMTDVIKHRGPDDEGFIVFDSLFKDGYIYGGKTTPENVYNSGIIYTPSEPLCGVKLEKVSLALGHRRLAIVDLFPSGHQPMCLQDSNTWLVYNGEIYNYLELRTELEALGHAFVSNSDTEVILAAYSQWGTDCLNRFNGMWAFALYDIARGKLFLARDRFGVKPLYYWITPSSKLIFASEIKAFTVLPEWKPISNGQRLHDFLVWGNMDHTNETMFSDVFQVPGGHLIELKIGEPVIYGQKLRIEKWYNLPTLKSLNSIEEAIKKFKEIFFDSVRLRLRADVPSGSCLSGGLDSSAIVCTMKKLHEELDVREPIRTFSACTDLQSLDERPYMECVSSTVNANSFYTYPDVSSLIGDLTDIVWYQDEPFGSTSIFAQWKVFELAQKSGVKVVLDGQGADEILGGYYEFYGVRIASLIKQLKIIELWSEIRSINKIFPMQKRSLLYRIGLTLVPAIGVVVGKLIGRAQVSLDWLNTKQLGSKITIPRIDLVDRSNSLREFSIQQMLITSLPKLLHWEDRNSMKYSLESRLPFLDYRLVEYALSIPDEYKLNRGVRKLILREAMAGILPEMIKKRMDKLGFVTPEEHWFKNTHTDDLRRLLDQAMVDLNGIISPALITRFENMLKGDEQFTFLFWRVITAGVWAKRFNVQIG